MVDLTDPFTRGTPTGKMIKIDDKWDAYIASPTPEKNHKNVALLYIPDVIGIWQNSQLMADQFAANGYHCLIIDVFNGDPLSLNRPEGFDFMKWLSEGSDGKNPHTKEAVDPIVVAAIKTMKEKHGVSKIGALGYCFGAKVSSSVERLLSSLLADMFPQYVARHYKDGIDVGFMAHPSFVEEDELAGITGPLSIAAAETDSIFPADKRHKSETILQKTGHPYQINLYSGVVHGFSVRCDTSKKVEKFAKEQAFLQAVHWFDTWLL